MIVPVGTLTVCARCDVSNPVREFSHLRSGKRVSETVDSEGFRNSENRAYGTFGRTTEIALSAS